jgi:hypothetical protein
MRAAHLAVDLDVTQPTDPSDRAQVRASKLSAAGLTFQQLTAVVTGNREAHRLTLDGTGEPLDTQLTVEGSVTERTGTGRAQTLMLDLARGACHLERAESHRLLARRYEHLRYVLAGWTDRALCCRRLAGGWVADSEVLAT